MNSHLVIQHKEHGRFIQVGNTKAFVYEKGEGEPVICFHGVPASSFLYRKVIDGLVQNGMRGISFDLLGLGLSDRPENFDYSWTNLGSWSCKVIEKLNLDKFHIVIHDIGGPIGCEVMSKMSDQILSVTILNTLLVDLPQFKKPFPMQFYAIKGIGELMINTTNSFLFKKLMHLRGVNQKNIFGANEAKAYLELLNGYDNARAFLKIMRSFEANEHKENLYTSTINSLNVPKQIIWGENDKGLTLEKHCIPLKEKLKIKKLVKVPGAHFLQEDYSNVISTSIVELSHKINKGH